MKKVKETVPLESTGKKFIMIGMGYIARKHLEAIQSVKGELVAFHDPNDSVGVVDSFFPGAKYFPEFERFDLFCTNYIEHGNSIDYLVVCSPNWLHITHTYYGLRLSPKTKVIVEKPAIISYDNYLALIKRKDYAKRVFPIFQLRYLEQLKSLKLSKGKANVHVDYHASRGHWYEYSWKGQMERSGGLATNIGCHLFDLCTYLFGKVKSTKLTEVRFDPETNFEWYNEGRIELDGATVYFKVSVRPYSTGSRRVFQIFSHGKSTQYIILDGTIDHLHKKVYKQIVNDEKNAFNISSIHEVESICQELREQCKKLIASGQERS